MLPRTLLIGCGRKQVKKVPEQCVAIDISEECITESKKIKPNNIYFNADAIKIPFEDNYFEKIIFTEVLEHVKDPKKALSEIRRVMKIGGKLIMSVPVGRTDDFIGKNFGIYERDVIRNHHKFLFSKENLEDLLKDFKEVKIVEKDKISTAFWYLWGLTDKILFDDLIIDDNGRITSEKHLKLSKLISRILYITSFFAQFFVKKKYYKTFYIEAVK